jgi:hypothetical protein
MAESTDLDLLLDLLIGPVFLRALVVGPPVDPAFLTTHVHTILRGSPRA